MREVYVAAKLKEIKVKKQRKLSGKGEAKKKKEKTKEKIIKCTSKCTCN